MVAFEDCQKLQKFQWKLSQTVPALDGNIAALKLCSARWSDLGDSDSVHAFPVEAQGLISQLEFHSESLRKMAEQSNRSADLVFSDPYYQSPT